MSWRIVHIKDGDYLRLKLDNIEIEKEDKKYHIALSDIAVIVLEGQKTTITTRLLDKFTQYNIVVVICDMKYQPVGIYLPLCGHHRMAKRLLIQLSVDDTFKKKLWTRIVKQKMLNQYLCLEQLKDNCCELSKIEKYMDKLRLGDPYNCEGQVAHMYFDSLYYKGFSRQFECIENMAMNFGYTILRSYIARLVIAQGLIPTLGIHHCNEYNQFNLVDDLIEPFRPLMDYWVNTVIMDGNDYLSYEKRLEIINFLNQPMHFEGKKTTIKRTIDLYVANFYKSLEQKQDKVLKEIYLPDFIFALED